MSLVRVENVKVGGSDWTAYATRSSVDITSDPIRISSSDVEAAVEVIPVTGSSTVGLVYQLSADGTNFYSPVNCSNISIADLIYNNRSLTNSCYVSFQPAAGEWIRFVMSPKAISMSATTTLKFIQQEDY